jgi:hypothetical protein
MLFRKIAEREIRGKIIDEFCYVAVCSIVSRLDNKSMENAINDPLCFDNIETSMDWLLTVKPKNSEAPKAFSLEKDAEKNVLEKLSKLPPASKVKFIDEKHLAKDSFWILTIKGKKEEINDLLHKIRIAAADPVNMDINPFLLEFRKYILCARNVDGSHLINAQKEFKKNLGPC